MSNIIVNLTKDDKVGTMTVMVPAFQMSFNDNDNTPQAITVRFALTELVSEWDFMKIRNQAIEKFKAKEQISEIEYDALGINSNAHYLFIQGKIAFQNHLWGDVILYLTQAYRELSSMWNSDKLDDFDRRIFGEICYMLGFTYSEFKQYEHSLHYLSIISSAGSIQWAGEYINSLTNSKDVRALGFVKNEILKLQNGSYKSCDEKSRNLHASFLKRRYGYILIDHGLINEAKEYFNGLLNDPDCKEFAESELGYISKAFPEA